MKAKYIILLLLFSFTALQAQRITVIDSVRKEDNTIVKYSETHDIMLCERSVSYLCYEDDTLQCEVKYEYFCNSKKIKK